MKCVVGTAKKERNPMSIRLMGVSYKEAALELRERVSFTESAKLEVLEELAAQGVSAVILSTCNRTEIYASDAKDSAERAVRAVLLRRADDAAERLHPLLYTAQDEQAVKHLFEVAAGLESLVLGEDQILGQVQDAYELSFSAGCTDKALRRVFQDAVESARRVKTMFKLSEQPLSVCSIGMRCVNEHMPIVQKDALVIGSGKMAQLAVQYLQQYGAKSITVCARSRREEPAQQFPGVQLADFERRYEYAAKGAVIVCATSAPHVVLRRAPFICAPEGTVILDLAAPRDADPALADMQGVTLLDVDALRRTAQENMQTRRALAEQAKEAILADVKETVHCLASFDVDEGIAALQRRCEAAERRAFALLSRRLELSGHEARHVQKILHAAVRCISRGPILTLKSLENADERAVCNDVLCRLFSQKEEDDDL